MHQRTWFYQKNIFYFILAFVLMMHLTALLLRASQKIAEVPSSYGNEKIKLKIINLPTSATLTTHQQIVQSESSESPQKPKTTRFLSDKNRSFDRQTVARNVDIFHESGAGDSQVSYQGQKNKASPVKKKTANKNLKLSDLGAMVGEDHPLKKAADNYSKSVRGLASGNPNKRGISSTNDFIEDIPLGDLTHLNTVEYKYYGFYHRIRQKLEQFWGRSIQEKAMALLKSGRKILASDNLITALQITLDEMGEITAIKVMGSSGVKELDEAAIESFNQAGPFPNPPKDLIVNGKVVLQWGFVVKS